MLLSILFFPKRINWERLNKKEDIILFLVIERYIAKEKVTLSVIYFFPLEELCRKKRNPDPSKNFWEKDIGEKDLLYISI